MTNVPMIWPSRAAMASDLGVAYQTVVAWGPRGIPPARLPAIRDAARDKGLAVTLDDLEGCALSDFIGAPPEAEGRHAKDAAA